jgi:copper oxidase (laccase) domain-containing protein
MIIPTASGPDRPGILQARSLEGLLPKLVHGFSTSLIFKSNPSVAASLAGMIAEQLECQVPPPVMLEQPHSANILELGNGRPMPAEVVTRGEHGTFLKGYDGASSDVHSPALVAVRAADCLPVLAVHTELEAYAALHAGWRGAAAGILPNLLGAWQKRGGSPSAVRLALGPGIRECCFEVREDCLSRFEPAHLGGAVKTHGGAAQLDLVRVLMAQAGGLGIDESQVEILPYCTYCHEYDGGGHPFASYRRSGHLNQRTDGRNLAFIGTAI